MFNECVFQLPSSTYLHYSPAIWQGAYVLHCLFEDQESGPRNTAGAVDPVSLGCFSHSPQPRSLHHITWALLSRWGIAYHSLPQHQLDCVATALIRCATIPDPGANHSKLRTFSGLSAPWHRSRAVLDTKVSPVELSRCRVSSTRHGKSLSISSYTGHNMDKHHIPGSPHSSHHCQ